LQDIKGTSLVENQESKVAGSHFEEGFVLIERLLMRLLLHFAKARTNGGFVQAGKDRRPGNNQNDFWWTIIKVYQYRRTHKSMWEAAMQQTSSFL
jgi:hypothetical protein